MKTKIFAYVTLCVVIFFVFANTFYIDREVSEIIRTVERFDSSEKYAIDKAQNMQEDFMRSSLFISLTVSHDDLTNIEDGFAELVGCLKVDDTDGATIIKSRLLNYLEHLRRLSGINFDSII